MLNAVETLQVVAGCLFLLILISSVVAVGYHTIITTRDLPEYEDVVEPDWD